ncbi:MAG: sigma-70 family RNA polymerase sigma factor [Anaerolineae bacterium]|nr:MAG: sigma-70 family RNA polymerase sigma factor [Anaerolineae bacterium]
MESEIQLLRQAREFNEEALAAIFDTYYRPLYRYLYHQTGHIQTAEDLAAKVFQRFLEALHKGQGPEKNLKAWLFKVAHHLAIDESRRFALRDHMPLDEQLIDVKLGMDEHLHIAHETERIHLALNKLTPQQRAVIILHFVEGLGNAEIAHILHSTIGAVKALQHRALATLRRQLIPNHIEGEPNEQPAL